MTTSNPSNTSAAPVQPWERLASPGHVLFARVNALRSRLPGMLGRAVLAALLMVVAVVFVDGLHKHASQWAQSLARVVAKPFATTPSTYSVAALPRASTPTLTSEQVQGLQDSQGVAGWLRGQLDTTIRAGKPLLGCRDVKITDAWPADAIGCRKSADGSRLWVWGLSRVGTGSGLRLQPVLVVYRLGQWTESGAKTWELRSVDLGGMSNVPPLEGLQSVRWDAVPRAAAADFAELAR